MARAQAEAIPIVIRRSGDRVHVPLHADGVGTVQLDVQRTGVVQYLLRLAGTAQNVQVISLKI